MAVWEVPTVLPKWLAVHWCEVFSVLSSAASPVCQHQLTLPPFLYMMTGELREACGFLDMQWL